MYTERLRWGGGKAWKKLQVGLETRLGRRWSTDALGALSVREKGVLSFLFQIFCSVDRLLLEVMEKKEHVEVIFKNIHNICNPCKS